MNRQKILVTGSAGFIGYHFTKSILNDGFNVLGIDNLNDYYAPNLKLDRLDYLRKYAQEESKNFNFIEGDISKERDVEKCFLENPFFVFYSRKMFF